ncbi:MAG: HesA/MoeB/ThiF family protein [Infirmifilum sp.]
MLTDEELTRYDRQIRVWGVEAQEKLKKSTVAIFGLGGLGSPVATYLVAAGVGRVILIDSEKVELSNLNRQFLHWTSDIGSFKVESAFAKLRKLNPDVKIDIINKRINTLDDALEIIREADIVVDCLDNWKTRFLINEACVKLSKPLIHAAIRGLYGQLMVVIPRAGPCLRCIFPENIQEEKHLPVAGPTAGFLGSLEALEALKILTGHGEIPIGRLFIFDGARSSFEVLKVSRREDCPVCSKPS